MERECINCHFAKWWAEDESEITEENDFLVCTNELNTYSSRNLNLLSNKYLEIGFFQVDDNDTCSAFKACEKRQKDLMEGC